MSKSATTGLVTGTLLTLAAVSTATANPIEFYSTTFDEFTNNTFISGTDGWAGGNAFKTETFWGSDDAQGVFYEKTGSGFGGNYHTLTTDGAAVKQRFRISFDMTLRLQDKDHFGYAGMALSHTANPTTDNGRWDTGLVRLARGPSDGGIKINYFDNSNKQVFVGGDLSGKLYSDYFYSFTVDVDPAQRVYHLVVTQTQKSTGITVELHNVAGVSFRSGSHTSLTSFELGLSNSSALSTGNNRVFFDNIQIVPEPSALALIAAGGGLLLKRR